MKRWTKLIMVNCVNIKFSLTKCNCIFSLSTAMSLQCSIDASSIFALNRHRASLTQKRCRPWFMADFRNPISETRSIACWPHTPDVSMWTGMKSTPEQMPWYFCCFFSSDAVAAEPAHLLLACTYDCIYYHYNYLLWPSKKLINPVT